MEILSAHLKTALPFAGYAVVIIAAALSILYLINTVATDHKRPNPLAIVFGIYVPGILFCLYLGSDVTLVAPRLLLAGTLIRNALDVILPWLSPSTVHLPVAVLDAVCVDVDTGMDAVPVEDEYPVQDTPAIIPPSVEPCNDSLTAAVEKDLEAADALLALAMPRVPAPLDMVQDTHVLAADALIAVAQEGPAVVAAPSTEIAVVPADAATPATDITTQDTIAPDATVDVTPTPAAAQEAPTVLSTAVDAAPADAATPATDITLQDTIAPDASVDVAPAPPAAQEEPPVLSPAVDAAPAAPTSVTAQDVDAAAHIAAQDEDAPPAQWAAHKRKRPLEDDSPRTLRPDKWHRLVTPVRLPDCDDEELKDPVDDAQPAATDPTADVEDAVAERPASVEDAAAEPPALASAAEVANATEPPAVNAAAPVEASAAEEPTCVPAPPKDAAPASALAVEIPVVLSPPADDSAPPAPAVEEHPVKDALVVFKDTVLAVEELAPAYIPADNNAPPAPAGEEHPVEDALVVVKDTVLAVGEPAPAHIAAADGTLPAPAVEVEEHTAEEAAPAAEDPAGPAEPSIEMHVAEELPVLVVENSAEPALAAAGDRAPAQPTLVPLPDDSPSDFPPPDEEVPYWMHDDYEFIYEAEAALAQPAELASGGAEPQSAHDESRSTCDVHDNDAHANVDSDASAFPAPETPIAVELDAVAPHAVEEDAHVIQEGQHAEVRAVEEDAAPTAEDEALAAIEDAALAAVADAVPAVKDAVAAADADAPPAEGNEHPVTDYTIQDTRDAPAHDEIQTEDRHTKTDAAGGQEELDAELSKAPALSEEAQVVNESSEDGVGAVEDVATVAAAQLAAEANNGDDALPRAEEPENRGEDGTRDAARAEAHPSNREESRAVAEAGALVAPAQEKKADGRGCDPVYDADAARALRDAALALFHASQNSDHLAENGKLKACFTRYRFTPRLLADGTPIGGWVHIAELAELPDVPLDEGSTEEHRIFCAYPDRYAFRRGIDPRTVVPRAIMRLKNGDIILPDLRIFKLGPRDSIKVPRYKYYEVIPGVPATDAARVATRQDQYQGLTSRWSPPGVMFLNHNLKTWHTPHERNKRLDIAKKETALSPAGEAMGVRKNKDKEGAPGLASAEAHPSHREESSIAAGPGAPVSPVVRADASAAAPRTQQGDADSRDRDAALKPCKKTLDSSHLTGADGKLKACFIGYPYAPKGGLDGYPDIPHLAVLNLPSDVRLDYNSRKSYEGFEEGMAAGYNSGHEPKPVLQRGFLHLTSDAVIMPDLRIIKPEKNGDFMIPPFMDYRGAIPSVGTLARSNRQLEFTQNPGGRLPAGQALGLDVKFVRDLPVANTAVPTNTAGPRTSILFPAAPAWSPPPLVMPPAPLAPRAPPHPYPTMFHQPVAPLPLRPTPGLNLVAESAIPHPASSPPHCRGPSEEPRADHEQAIAGFSVPPTVPVPPPRPTSAPPGQRERGQGSIPFIYEDLDLAASPTSLIIPSSPPRPSSAPPLQGERDQGALPYLDDENLDLQPEQAAQLPQAVPSVHTQDPTPPVQPAQLQSQGHEYPAQEQHQPEQPAQSTHAVLSVHTQHPQQPVQPSPPPAQQQHHHVPQQQQREQRIEAPQESSRWQFSEGAGHAVAAAGAASSEATSSARRPDTPTSAPRQRFGSGSHAAQTTTDAQVEGQNLPKKQRRSKKWKVNDSALPSAAGQAKRAGKQKFTPDPGVHYKGRALPHGCMVGDTQKSLDEMKRQEENARARYANNPRNPNNNEPAQRVRDKERQDRAQSATAGTGWSGRDCQGSEKRQ
ncbi:hypothetical protein AURDEDRAFT_114123 [Auricularia subglabra TFB-10046 SS5]|nr:hypothetical protein AURDEDRAFT_114123 [Auricularia subglabra TFB-10046 SS5]